jgi:hypothetical protein
MHDAERELDQPVAETLIESNRTRHVPGVDSRIEGGEADNVSR